MHAFTTGPVRTVGGQQSTVTTSTRLQLSSVSNNTVITSAKNTNDVKTTTTTGWFPTRIQETVPYRDIVQRLYLRQIVTETKALADWVVQQVYDDGEDNKTNSENNDDNGNGDNFAALARKVSVCQYTRDEGGKIGWVEPEEEYQVLPADVIDQIYDRQPKPGDILVVPCASTGQWHCVQVMEAWMQPPIETTYETDRVGAHQGINSLVRRPKLKGAGVLPTLPSNMRTYSIQTAGCQMNVADSERLAGVLQDQLKMVPAKNPSEADLVLLNTCR